MHKALCKDSREPQMYCFIYPRKSNVGVHHSVLYYVYHCRTKLLSSALSISLPGQTQACMCSSCVHMFISARHRYLFVHFLYINARECGTHVCSFCIVNQQRARKCACSSWILRSSYGYDGRPMCGLKTDLSPVLRPSWRHVRRMRWTTSCGITLSRRGSSDPLTCHIFRYVRVELCLLDFFGTLKAIADIAWTRMA